AFLCGLLNAQPMGFYAPAQLVRDAREHGVEVRPVDVSVSAWESTLEGDAGARGEGASLRQPLRLGLNRVKGLAEEAGQRIVAAPSEGEETLADYRTLGLTLNRHPLALLRPQLAAFRIEPASRLRTYPNGRLARASGLVTHRQRPETANGTVFVTLEDDTGAINVIVWPKIAE